MNPSSVFDIELLQRQAKIRLLLLTPIHRNPTMVKQPTIVNATSHKPTIILLILNLIATIALLAHVVYYIPSSTSGSAAANNNNNSAAAGVSQDLESNGVGTIGLDKTNRVQFELIKLKGEGADPEVLQTVTVTQQDFLNSFERFLAFRDMLEEKELIRRNEE